MGLGLHMAPRTRQKRKRYRILVGLRTESPRGRSSRVPGPLFPGGRSVNPLGKATALQLPSQEAHRPLAPLWPLGDRKGTINRWRHHLVSLSHSQSPGLLSLCLHLIALWINTQTNKQKTLSHPPFMLFQISKQNIMTQIKTSTIFPNVFSKASRPVVCLNQLTPIRMTFAPG